MWHFPVAWVARTLGVELPENARNMPIYGVSIDTRKDIDRTLFFALKGEHSDGHDYVAKAFEKGARAAVVSKRNPEISSPQLVVPDTLTALGDLAKAWRLKMGTPIIGITGSVGKTSTKEMIAAILGRYSEIIANEGNYNNEIGVPLTLLRLNPSYRCAVVEMGMRGLGEIDHLAEIAAPTIGVITNIGFAHIERLGSQEKIAEAKSELLARLPSDGVAVLPADDKFLPYLKSRVPQGAEIMTFGRAEEATVRLIGNQVVFNGETATLDIPATGVHHNENAAAAIAVCVSRGYRLQNAIEALSNWYGAEGRMNMIRLPNDITVLDDCYNAGIESMTAALQTLNAVAKGRKVAVIGDMKELGNFDMEAHKLVGQEILKNGVDMLVTVGFLARVSGMEATRLKESTVRWKPTDTAEEAAERLKEIIESGDTVLVKGSRSMHMEKIVKAITGQESENAHA